MDKMPPNRLILRLYEGGLAPLLGRFILLLTTTGRKSGLPRTTPLQYEVVNGAYYLGSARGKQADWFRNIRLEPQVTVRVKNHVFDGLAEPVTDPARITDFLELRLSRHPRMVGKILQMEGLPSRPTRSQLEDYARRLAMVIIHPERNL
jgi:deazaflavin-dependent oxidoreductase (nitroreductase family)